MASADDPLWLPRERKVSSDEWDDFRRRYATELGFDQEPDYRSTIGETQIIKEANALTGNSNWHLLMPKDSITRMESASNLYRTFKDIVQDTTRNALRQTEPQPLDLYFVASNVISRFKGSSDFHIEDIRTGSFESQEEQGNSVYDNMTIVVSSTNSRNFEDWYIYDVENASEIFGDELYSMTEAAHAIYKAGLKPEQILQDVAFTLRDQGMDAPSVSGVEPPANPVAIVSIDPHDRGYYYQIDTPQETFGDDWGDVELMDRRLSSGGIESKKIGEASVGYWIITGVNW